MSSDGKRPLTLGPYLCLSFLRRRPRSVDQLAEKLERSRDEVQAWLDELEAESLVRPTQYAVYRLTTAGALAGWKFCEDIASHLIPE